MIVLSFRKFGDGCFSIALRSRSEYSRKAVFGTSKPTFGVDSMRSLIIVLLGFAVFFVELGDQAKAGEPNEVQLQFTGDFAGDVAAGKVVLRVAATSEPLANKRVFIKLDSGNRDASEYLAFETDDKGEAHWFIGRLIRRTGEYYEYSKAIAEFNLKGKAGREYESDFSSAIATIELPGAGSGSQPVAVMTPPTVGKKPVDPQRVPLAREVGFASLSYDPDSAQSPAPGAGITAHYWSVLDERGELLRGSGSSITVRLRMTGAHTVRLLVWDREGHPGIKSEQFTVIEPRRPVIFVPGMAASDLLTEDGEQLWPTIRFDKILRLSLEPGKSTTIYATSPSREFDPFFTGLFEVDIQGPFLEALAKQGNYKEYEVTGTPKERHERMTAAGIDLSQAPDDEPLLFPFAYDWRRSNAESAASLGDYIRGIRLLYPNTKVDIVAHSMGGLVARRYILSAPDNHHVEKMVTIGSPILGAPVAIYRLHRGYFFEGDLKGAVLDLVTTSAIRKVLRHFPGLHELLPSELYFKVASSGTAVREDGVDLNRNGAYHDALSFAEFVRWMDADFPDTTPGSQADRFHTRQQDDWSSDAPTVKNLYIVGEQSQPNTTGEILVGSRIVSDGRTAEEIRVFGRRLVDGDQTVPFESAYRWPLHWAPGASAFVFVGNGDGKEEKANHLGMLDNPVVLEQVLAFLKDSPSQVSPSTGVLRPRVTRTGSPEERIFVEFVGMADFDIRDSAGNTSVRTNGVFALGVPGGEIDRQDDRWARLILPSTNNYTITMKWPGKGGSIGIALGANPDTPTTLTRFLDLDLPAGSAVRLEVPADRTPRLYSDRDGDGVVDTEVAAQVSVSGETIETIAPTLSHRIQCESGTPTIHLVAMDSSSGETSIYYSLDGSSLLRYAGPIPMNGLPTSSIRAFASDRFGNRSSFQRFEIVPKLSLTRPASGVIRLSWETTCLPLTLEHSRSLERPLWLPVEVPQIINAETTFVDLPEDPITTFFWLRLAE